MTMTDWLPNVRTTAIPLDEDRAERLRHPIAGDYTVGVYPPRRGDTTPVLTQLAKQLRSARTGLFGLRNQSPVIAYELRRPRPDRLGLQLAVPSKRVERTYRTQLPLHVDRVQFTDGTDGLPVTAEDSIGGAVWTTTKPWPYPLRTTFQAPPINSVVATLHRHAMQNTRFVLQILAQPIAGRLRHWWGRKIAGWTRDELRTEQEGVVRSRQPTRYEREQANAVDTKSRQPHWQVSIRLVVINGDEYTLSRAAEIGSAFSMYENAESGQRLRMQPLKVVRRSEIRRFAQAVAERRFGSSAAAFRVTDQELGALLSVPIRADQSNLTPDGSRR